MNSQNDQMLKIQHYRYKLNKNANKFYKKDVKENFTANIENHLLSTEKWLITRSEIPQLKHLIKTKDNKEGIIDCHIYIPATGQIIKDFGLDEKVKVKSNYTVEELFVMNREQITAICEKLEIPYTNRTNKVLISDILQKNTKTNKDGKKRVQQN